MVTERYEYAGVGENREGAHVAARLLQGRTTNYVYLDRLVSQDERIFLIEGAQPNPLPHAQKTHKREGILEMRWWHTKERQSTIEPVFPAPN
jgi:hypothetical protein